MNIIWYSIRSMENKNSTRKNSNSKYIIQNIFLKYKIFEKKSWRNIPMYDVTVSKPWGFSKP